MTVKRFKIVDIEEELYPMIIYYDRDKELTYDEVCDLLNELHEENKGIQDKIFKLLEWLETEKGVSRKEIKEWWND